VARRVWSREQWTPAWPDAGRVEGVALVRQRCRIRQPALQRSGSTCSITNDTHARAAWRRRGWLVGRKSGQPAAAVPLQLAAFFLRAPFSGRSAPRVSENVRRISTHPAGAAPARTRARRALSPCAQEFCAALGAHILSAAAAAAPA
jgi:hypothetical protein